VVVLGVTVSEPATALVPLQPPEAKQEVALVDVHVKVDDWPTLIDVGLAKNVSVGG